MIRFKNHKPGFSFIEIVVTLLLFSTLVTALLLSLNTTYTAIYRYSNKLGRIFLLKQRLFQSFFDRAQGKDKPEKEKKIENPATTIMYELRDPKADSALKKFENIKIEKVTATWSEAETKQTESMISFVFKQKEGGKGG